MLTGKKLKVLFIPRWYPGRLDPFNGIFIQRHAEAVAIKNQIAVMYICADPNMQDRSYETDLSVENNVQVVRVYYKSPAVNFSFLSSAMKLFRYLWACRIGIRIIHKKFGIPGICHIHVLSRTFFIVAYYKYFHNISYIISEQWSGYLPEDAAYKGFFKTLLTRIAVRRASAVTTVSESLKTAMISHSLENNYTVIPNTVDTNTFYFSEHFSNTGKYILLHVSNLDDRAKNVSGMIRAVKCMSDKRDDFEFHIVGDGSQKEIFESQAAQLGLLNKIVFFLGAKKTYEVAEMMRKADLFLLFSNYDNMPCVMVESFASGLPVIGSAIHGIKEHVQEGRGILVLPGDEKAFCDAIIKAVNSIRSFDKRKLEQYARSNFSYEAVAVQFDKIYQKVIYK